MIKFRLPEHDKCPLTCSPKRGKCEIPLQVAKNDCLSLVGMTRRGVNNDDCLPTVFFTSFVQHVPIHQDDARFTWKIFLM